MGAGTNQPWAFGASVYQGVEVRKKVKILAGHLPPPSVTPMLKINDTVNCNLQMIMTRECKSHVQKIEIHSTAGVLKYKPLT